MRPSLAAGANWLEDDFGAGGPALENKSGKPVPFSSRTAGKGSKSVPPWVYAAGGGAASLILVLIALLIVNSRRSGAPAATTPPSSIVASHTPAPAAVLVIPPAAASPPAVPAPTINTPVPAPPLAASAAKSPRPGGRPADNDPVPSVAELIEQIESSIVLITIRDASGTDVGLGTGFIIDESGLVATNFHVMRDGASAYVQFHNGEKFEVAGFRAFDQKADLAIIQLADHPPEMNVIKLAGTELPRQGSEVIAVGHPSGFKFTVTTGIVSAVHTTTELPPMYQQALEAPPDQVWIQTNAAISHGNSGGPLLNQRGEVLGINTWVAKGSNLGFASHVRHLKDLQQKLKPEVIALQQVEEGRHGPASFLKGLKPAVARVFEEYARSATTFRQRLQQANSPQELQRMLIEQNPNRVFSSRFMELADRNPRSTIAFQSLILVCRLSMTEGSPDSNAFDKASQQLLKEYVNEPTLRSALLLFVQDAHPQMADFLEQLAKQSADRGTQGVAYFCAAMALDQNPNAGRRGRAAVLDLLNKVVKEYGDVELGDATLAKLAEPVLFKKQKLSVGAEAPELVGQDSSGRTFQLREMRGKIVVVDFFADWCPFCRRMYPEERQLCELFKNKPFALVGINADPPGKLQKLINDGEVTWPCIADGPQGPLAARWQISSFPMIYVIDAKGVIRHQFAGDPGSALREAVENLIAESEGKKVAPVASRGVDLMRELTKLERSRVAEPASSVILKAQTLMQANRAQVKPDHLAIVDAWIKEGRKQDPKSTIYQGFAAHMMELRGKYPQAISAYRAVLKRDDTPRIVRGMVQRQLAYLLAVRRQSTKEVGEAETLSDHSLQTLGPMPETLDTRAVALLAAGRPGEARQFLKMALDLDEQPLFFFHLAQIELASKNKDAAADAWEECERRAFTREDLLSLEKESYEKLKKSLAAK